MTIIKKRLLLMTIILWFTIFISQISLAEDAWCAVRFTVPAGVFTRPLETYQNTHRELLVGFDCSLGGCPKDSQEKRIRLSDGNNGSYEVSVCEKCNLETCNCGVKLNTNIPFIGRCIMYENSNASWQSWDVTTVNALNAFPILMGSLIKLLMSVIMVVCFGSLIVWGFMMTIPDQYDTGKWIVMKVIRTIVALWSLWTILYLINPNFFT